MSLLQRRIYAFVIDLYVIYFLAKAVVFAFSRFLQQLFLICPQCPTKFLRLNTSLTFTFTLNFIFLSYFVLCYYLGNGTSFGKLVMKIRIYSQITPQISLQQAFLRAIAQTLYYLMLFLPFGLQLLNAQFRSLGDRLANTFVAIDQGPELVFGTIPTLALPILDVYPEVIQLPCTSAAHEKVA